MTVLICSDLHLSDNARDSYRFVFLREVLPTLIKKHKVKEVRCLGDLTETYDRHSSKLVNDIVAGLDAIAELTDLLILRGNHDYTDPDHPFFAFVRLLPNVKFINNPTLVGSTLYLPHTRDPEREWKQIGRETGIKQIFAHQTFNGAAGNFGHQLEGADLSWLPNVPIISGDVHVPQEFDNLTYVGAPYTVDFGDDYQGRVLIDGKSVPVKMPQKWVYRATDLGTLPKGEFMPGDVLKVEVPIKRKDYAQWSSVTRLIKAWGADQELKIDSIVPLIVDKVKTKPKAALRLQVDDDETLKQYAKLHKIDERTLKVGLELLI